MIMKPDTSKTTLRGQINANIDEQINILSTSKNQKERHAALGNTLKSMMLVLEDLSQNMNGKMDERITRHIESYARSRVFVGLQTFLRGLILALGAGTAGWLIHHFSGV